MMYKKIVSENKNILSAEINEIFETAYSYFIQKKIYCRSYDYHEIDGLLQQFAEINEKNPAWAQNLLAFVEPLEKQSLKHIHDALSSQQDCYYDTLWLYILYILPPNFSIG